MSLHRDFLKVDLKVGLLLAAEWHSVIQAADRVVAVLEGLHDHHHLAGLHQGCQGRHVVGVSSCVRPLKSDLKVRSQVQPSRLGSHLDLRPFLLRAVPRSVRTGVRCSRWVSSLFRRLPSRGP